MDEELNVDIEDDEDEDTRGRRRESSGDGYYNAALKDDERFTKMWSGRIERCFLYILEMQ